MCWAVHVIRAVDEFVGIGLGPVGHALDRATEGCVGLGDENPRRIIDAGDRDEVADRERELLDLRSKRVQVRVAEQHDVTVGGALEHVFGSDHTAAPRADH